MRNKIYLHSLIYEAQIKSRGSSYRKENEKNNQIYPFLKGNLAKHQYLSSLTLSRRRPLLYRNQSIDLQSKPMGWFLYYNGLRLERVKLQMEAGIISLTAIAKMCSTSCFLNFPSSSHSPKTMVP